MMEKDMEEFKEMVGKMASNGKNSNTPMAKRVDLAT